MLDLVSEDADRDAEARDPPATGGKGPLRSMSLRWPDGLARLPRSRQLKGPATVSLRARRPQGRHDDLPTEPSWPLGLRDQLAFGLAVACACRSQTGATGDGLAFGAPLPMGRGYGLPD